MHENGSEETRLSIIKHAIKLIASDGDRVVSIRTIAESASVKHSLIYYYFKNKDDLMYNAAAYLATRLQQQQESLKLINKDEMSTEMQFKTMIRSAYDYAINNIDEAIAYRKLLTIPNSYISYETYCRLIRNPGENCPLIKLLIDSGRTIATLNILSYEASLFCYWPIFDFAIANSQKPESEYINKEHFFINALWNSIKE